MLIFVKTLDTAQFDCKSLNTNVPVDDAIKCLNTLVLELDNAIPNKEFIIELLNVNLQHSLMNFDGEYFQNFHQHEHNPRKYILARRENVLKEKCKTEKN